MQWGWTRWLHDVQLCMYESSITRHVSKSTLPVVCTSHVLLLILSHAKPSDAFSSS